MFNLTKDTKTPLFAAQMFEICVLGPVQSQDQEDLKWRHNLQSSAKNCPRSKATAFQSLELQKNQQMTDGSSAMSLLDAAHLKLAVIKVQHFIIFVHSLITNVVYTD